MTSASNIVMRLAARHDLKEIVQLLLDDTLAGVHELPGDSAAGGLSESYLCAWRQIEASDENEILVAIDPPQVIAVLQLTFIPSLTLRGSRRAQIEGVRVASLTGVMAWERGWWSGRFNWPRPKIVGWFN